MVRLRDIIAIAVIINFGAFHILAEEENFVLFVMDIQQHFNVRSLILYEPDHVKRSVNLIKRFSKKMETFITVENDMELLEIPLSRTLVVYGHYEGINVTEKFQFINNHKKPSSYIWLIISPYDLTQEFQRIFIPFDCNFLLAEMVKDGYILTEIYKVSADFVVISNFFGIWSTSDGLKISSKPLYERRNNFYGTSLLVRPMLDLSGGIFSRQNDFFPNIWRSIGQKLNLTSIYMLPETEFDIDVASNGYRAPTNEEEWLFPIVPVRVNLFYREPRELMVWNKYLNPLSGTSWLVTFLWMTVSAVTLTVSLKLLPKDPTATVADPARLLLDSFYVLLQKSTEVSSKSWGVRVVIAMELLGSFALFGAYSAVFISFITVFTTTVPFTTLEGIIEDGRYNIVVVREKAYPFLQRNTHPTIQTLLKNRVMPYDKLIGHFDEGFQRICAGEDRLMTELTDMYIRQVRSKLPEGCRIAENSVPLLNLQTSWKARRYSYFKEVIQNKMWKLRESGAVGELIWQRDFLDKSFDRKQARPPDSIRLEEVFFLLCALAVGVVISLLCLYSEMYRIRTKISRLNICWK